MLLEPDNRALSSSHLLEAIRKATHRIQLWWLKNLTFCDKKLSLSPFMVSLAGGYFAAVEDGSMIERVWRIK